MMKGAGLPGEVTLRRAIAGWAFLTGCILLTGCVRPEDSGVQVIVGARLEPGAGRAPLEHSVVVIADGKFQAVGRQSSTPVPIGAKMTNGLGMTIEPLPGGEPIESGRPANLVLKGGRQRVMRAGAWVE
jgi:hypothetical protein